MNKKIYFASLCIIFVLIVMSVLSYCCLSPHMFINSNSISKVENVEIKSIVLSAFKDRYSIFESSKKVNYYDEHSDRIIQLSQPLKKNFLFYLINWDFMNTIEVQKDGCYRVIVKMYYPENYYHEFLIENKNNEYIITSWEFDT